MISESIRRPGSYNEITVGAMGGLPSMRQDMLIIAPRLADGTVAAGVPAQVTSPAQAAEFWGAGSIMHRMAWAAFRQYGSLSLTGCAVDDASTGVGASAAITFTGSADATGQVTLWVGTDRIPVRVDRFVDGLAGGTPVKIASDLADQVNARPDLPVTAYANGAVITLTAKNKGTTGNFLGQKGKPAVDCDVPGIEAATTAYTGGAGDPDLTDTFDKVSGQRFHIVALAWATAAAAIALSEYLNEVSNEVNQRGGRGFMFVDGNIADMATLAKGINDKRICVGGITGAKRAPFENAAAFAAMLAAEPMPWLAVNNIGLVGCDSPPVTDRWNWNEINNILLWSGVTPFEVGAGDRVRCVRAISTYVKNDAGAEDDTFLDTLKIATADYVREAVRVRHLTDFQNKVLRDNHVAGEPPNVVTPADVRSTNLDVCRRIEAMGGLNSVNAFADQFVSVRNRNVPGRVDSIIPIDIVDALHILANNITITSTL
ncbi:MAG: phage tail sheath subtilisin-like domain-containing protein [Chitinispirillia bacterium]|nr:phage tail sheath subtilisin-like domain-containing protein [Chitinispirillia bacterium]MCL2268601.1 phage tail sheath subtilisin-like domain-containing protein [Chitinispirillia bacterium]